MSEVECERCGAVFDTEREGVTPGQNTDRCPSCGAEHTLNSDEAAAAVTVGEDSVIELHVHIHRD